MKEQKVNLCTKLSTVRLYGPMPSVSENWQITVTPSVLFWPTVSDRELSLGLCPRDQKVWDFIPSPAGYMWKCPWARYLTPTCSKFIGWMYVDKGSAFQVFLDLSHLISIEFWSDNACIALMNSMCFWWLFVGLSNWSCWMQVCYCLQNSRGWLYFLDCKSRWTYSLQPFCYWASSIFFSVSFTFPCFFA